MFNSGPILGSQAGDTTNPWNSPAEAGKDSDTKDAAITLKKYSREFNVTYSDPSQADVLKKWLNDRVNADAWIKWYDSLNPKPTGVNVNLKMVPTGTEGSKNGFQLPGGYTLVPTEIGGEIKVPFNTPRNLEDIKNIFKK